MNLTLVIPTHNRNNDVAQLVESISRQTLDGLQIELIIVSNLKNSVLEKWITNYKASFPVFYYEAGRIGVNTARNLGIKKSSSGKIYFLDDDVVLKNPLHLKTIHELAIQNPQIAAIGGSYYLSENSKVIDQVYHAICTSWISEGPNGSHLVGGNTLYNFDLLKDDLNFNENIIFGGSETELNLRLLTSGHKFIFSDRLNVQHSTDLTMFALVKKAIRQGMGRSFHEKIVPADFWINKTKSSQLFIKKSAAFYLSLYNFFFHVGYRHGKRQNNGPLSKKVIFICTLETFFQINADKTLYIPNSKDKPFHLQNVPGLKFRELHHWFKAHVWWKIPNYLFWKVIPFAGNMVIYAVGTLFPFDPQGLRTAYYRTFSAIEKLIQGNN